MIIFKWIFKNCTGGLHQIYVVKERVKWRNCVKKEIDMGIYKCKIFSLSLFEEFSSALLRKINNNMRPNGRYLGEFIPA